MAHEIGEFDNVVLHREKAWHGLGIVVENAPTPQEALKIAGLDWDVDRWSLTANGEHDQLKIDSHVANVRRDTGGLLGIVSGGYQVVQNRELADFASALAEESDVIKIESAGSIRNGQKVWFLVKGESFSVRGDENVPYICISNGHDGLTGLRCTPTTVRVVCSNTLHMVIPSRDGANVKMAGFASHHTGNIMERVDQAKATLKLYGKNLEDTRKVIDAVAAKDIKSREDVQAFFLNCFTADFGSTPSNPTNKSEERKYKKAMEACNIVFNRFDKEVSLVGANYWAAFNAYTGWLQNDRTSRLKDQLAAAEAKTGSRLFGEDSLRTHHSLQVALSA